MISVGLLAIAVLGVFARPARWPVWGTPMLVAVASLVFRQLTIREALDAGRPLGPPLLFLLTAVPLAVLLDRLGFFSAVASLFDNGRHLDLGLWVLAALVTTVLNLDASVVLLTPLYIRIARRHGRDPLPFAIQPAVAAALSSSALPVSNLTNLIAAERLKLGAVDFLTHLGPASLLATVVGYLAYCRTFRRERDVEPERDHVDRSAIRRGLPIVGFVLLGFTVGDGFGVPAWIVAFVATLWTLTLLSDRSLPELPWGAAILALSLGLVASAAAPHLGLGLLLGQSTVTGDLRTLAVAVLGANAINNLPATLLGTGILRAGDARIWPMLVGVNFGPGLIVTGALAGLLWRDTAARLGVIVSARRFSAIGLRIVAPALVVAGAVVVATNAVLR